MAEHIKIEWYHQEHGIKRSAEGKMTLSDPASMGQTQQLISSAVLGPIQIYAYSLLQCSIMSDAYIVGSKNINNLNFINQLFLYFK